MSHFAKVLDGVVVQVIKAEPEFFDTFVDSTPGEWIQTSYNTVGGVHYLRNDDGSLAEPSNDQTKALRKNFAGVGFSYRKDLDAFISPKPFESWVLNEESCLWEAPTEQPNDGRLYAWDENTKSWVDQTPESATPVEVLP